MNVSSSLERDKPEITMLHSFYKHISKGIEEQTSFLFSEEPPPLQTTLHRNPSDTNQGLHSSICGLWFWGGIQTLIL